jgi:hypothetical protein
MGLIIISWDMLTQKTTGIGVVKTLIQLPLYDQRTGVWCAISASIIVLIFYEGTLDAEQYINELSNPFFVNLAAAEERFGYLMQDGVTTRTRTHTHTFQFISHHFPFKIQRELY